MEEKDNNPENISGFNYERDVFDESAFELSGNYWRTKYESERSFWEERLDASHKEKESLKNESAQLKSVLDNLSFKIQELEHRFSEDKMLYEQRLEIKIKELEKAQERSGYEERIKQLEKRNIILRKGLMPQDVLEDTELRSPSAVIALASQKIMLDLALEKEALQKKMGELTEELNKKQSSSGSAITDLEMKIKNLQETLKQKDALAAESEEKIERMLKEAKNRTAEQTEAFQKSTENIVKEHTELSSEFALKIQDMVSDNIILAKNFLKDKKISGPFEQMINSSQKMSEAVSFFIEISGLIKPALKEENIESVIDDVLGEVLPEILSKNILIEKKYATNGFNIMIDKIMIMRALKAVFDNAIEAMSLIAGDGKTLSVDAGYDNITNDFVVTIKDTGCGIPADDLGKVMRPYFSKKQDRQGLGLFYANKVMKLHGGSIFIESAKGTTVKLHFKV